MGHLFVRDARAALRRVMRRGAVAGATLASLAVASALAAAPAAASTEVLVNEPFTGTSTSSPNWALPSAPTGTNVACLTAGTPTSGGAVPGCSSPPADSPGDGALQLTADSGGEEGGIAYELSVPTVDGIDATFDSYQYDKSSGADGIGFFLAAADPADPQPPTDIGQPGGALGYSAVASTSKSGMSYGYLGIGLDVYGNYENTQYEGTGCTNPAWDSAKTFPNNVTVRGPGNGTVGYCMLDSTQTSSGDTMSGTLDGGTTGPPRSNAKVPVEVVINPTAAPVVTESGLTVSADSYMVAFTPISATSRQTLSGPLPSVAGRGFPSSWYDPVTGIPYQLTFGWVGSTGGDMEIHEVNDVVTGTASGIPPTLTASVMDSAGGAPASGSTFDYNVTVGNENGTSADPGPISVTDTLPAGETPDSTGLGTNGWSCSISGQTVSCQNPGPLASGAVLPTLVIPATVTASQGSELTDTATASSDDSDPATGQDSVTVATPPTDTSSCGTPDGQNGYFVTDPTCEVQGTDPFPDIDHVAYQLDSGSVITTSSGTTTATVPITTDGTHTLKTEIFNTSGQGSGWRSQTIDVDTTPPTDTSSCGTPDGQNGYFVTDPTCTVQGTDSISGVDHVAYQLDSGSVITTSSGTTTATVPITTDGTHTLKTEIFNAAGLDSGWTTQTIKVDTTAPTDTSTCGAPNGQNGWFTTDPSCTIQASDSDGVAQVQYHLDSASTQSGSSGATTSVTDGAHTLYTRAEDDAGNWSAWRTQTIDVDTTPPTDTSSCGTPDGQNGYFVTDPTCTVQGTDSISGVDHVAYQLDSGSVITTSSGTTTATVPITTDGTHTLKTEIFNAAGLDSGWTTQTIKVDTTAPGPPVIDSPANGSVSNDTSPTVTVTGDPGDSAMIEVDGTSYGPVTLDGQGNGEVQLPGPLTPGQHQVQADQTDPAGVTSSWTQSVWTIKTQTNVELSGPTSGPIDDTTPTVSYSGEAGDEFTITVDGTSVATGVIPSDGNGSLALPDPLADGPHTVAIAATDAAGNQASDSIVITIDTVAPSVTIVTAPAEYTPSHDATFSFAATKPATYQCSLDGAAWSACPSPVTFTGLQDGAHTLLVRATDQAGNVSPSADYSWTVETTPPAPPVILDGPNTDTTPGPAQFEISTQPDTTLQCSLDGDPYEPCTEVYDVQTLPVGTYVLSVRAVDEAGNDSSPTSYTWNVVWHTGPAGLPRTAALLIASNATVNDGRDVDVGCSLNAGSIQRCHVIAYYHGRPVGAGTAVEQHRGHTHTVVTVWLNAAGRQLLQRADGGLPLKLVGFAKPFGFARLRPRTHTVLFEPLRFALGDVLFKFNSSTLTPSAYAIVVGIAREIKDARTVVCEGNTDSVGTSSYNYGLGLRRAQTVCTLLRKLGVHARYGVVSYGASRPVVPNDNPRDRHLNRRVVIRVSFHDLVRRHRT